MLQAALVFALCSGYIHLGSLCRPVSSLSLLYFIQSWSWILILLCLAAEAYRPTFGKKAQSVSGYDQKQINAPALETMKAAMSHIVGNKSMNLRRASVRQLLSSWNVTGGKIGKEKGSDALSLELKQKVAHQAMNYLSSLSPTKSTAEHTALQCLKLSIKYLDGISTRGDYNVLRKLCLTFSTVERTMNLDRLTEIATKHAFEVCISRMNGEALSTPGRDLPCSSEPTPDSKKKICTCKGCSWHEGKCVKPLNHGVTDTNFPNFCSTCAFHGSGHRSLRGSLCCCAIDGTPCYACDLKHGACARLSCAGFVKCAPCVLQSITVWAQRYEIEFLFVPCTYDTAVPEILRMLFFKSSPRGELTSEELLERDTLVHSVAKSICNLFGDYVQTHYEQHSVQTYTCLPKYVLLRKPGFDWIPVLLDTLFIKKRGRIGTQVAIQRNMYSGLSPDTVVELQCFAALFRIQYAGPFLNTSGTSESFQPCPNTVPGHPSNLAVRLRKTYWRYVNASGKVDVLLFSKHALFLSLLEMKDVSSTADFETLLRFGKHMAGKDISCFRPWMGQAARLLSKSCEFVQDDAGTLFRKFVDETNPAVWNVRREGCARRLLLTDYELLAKHMGFVYKGCIDSNEQLDPRGFPETMFQPRAVFSTGDEEDAETTVCSYYNLLMQLHRRQPTIAAVRGVALSFERNNERLPTDDELATMFPSQSKDLVLKIWEGIQGQLQMDANHLAMSVHFRHDVSDSAEEKMQPCNSQAGITVSSTTDLAQKLAAENLQMACNDLMTLNPRLIREWRRSKDGLSNQVLPPGSLQGLKIAGQRGLRCLSYDYNTEIIKHCKTLTEDLPGANEGIDSETKYEHLPLSPLLIKKMKDGKCYTLTTQLAKTMWTLIQDCAQKVDVAIKQHLEEIDGITKHEETLGVVTLLMRAEGFLPTTRPSTTNAETLRCHVLNILATAAWVEMTERWHRMPEHANMCLSMVCNHSTLDIRQYGRLVFDEHTLSSTPLVDHICAMCGHLLCSLTRNAHSPREVGCPGLPCQVRKKACNWDDLPLFLLLWSKRKIANSIPALFALDANNKLTLHHGLSSAPWLNFKKRGRSSTNGLPTKNDGDLILDVSKPWWFCSVCYKYWSPSSGVVAEDNIQRVPMRNRLEGLYTRWHLDVAYVHLYPSIRRLWPTLTSLPTPAAVLKWQRKYIEWVRLLQSQGLTDKNKTEKAVHVDTLKAELDKLEMAWSPPPHATSEGTPVPIKFFHASMGSHKKEWKLGSRFSTDLVVLEQPDLIQDVGQVVEFDDIQSADARACVSLCRPIGTFIDAYLAVFACYRLVCSEEDSTW
jgi:hypothetical protein